MIYINQNFSSPIELSLSQSLYTGFRVGTNAPTAISVDWGDGSTSSYSGSFMSLSHTYDPPYTGDMKINCSDGNDLIVRIDEFSPLNTPSSIVFTTSQLQKFINLQFFSCLESNVITGNLIDIPTTLTRFLVYGLNTISGSIENLPVGLTHLYVLGKNTTTGNISQLPIGLLQYNNSGLNETTGDISQLPENLTLYANYGANKTTGDISQLPNSLTFFAIHGKNTTTGNISQLPIGLLQYNNSGLNETTGDISQLPENLTLYLNYGANTTTGDISQLPENIDYYDNRGQNTVVTYVSGRVWKNPMKIFRNSPTLFSGGLSEMEVDSILIDLSIRDWIIGDGIVENVINLAGNNAPRTTASDSAVSTLLLKGVNVIVN